MNSSLLEFMFASGRRERVGGPATSIAVYELQEEGDRFRYCHRCSVAEEEPQLRDA